MKNSNVLSSLILTFMKIGLFTFGGGYAMISLIDSECVEKRKWLTHDELMNITVIAESTPGPIAINCATYVGYRQAGFLGAILSTIGIVFPSFVVIYLISLFFDNILEITVVANAFRGIKIAVGVLILSVAVKMVQKINKGKLPIIIMSCSLATMLAVNFWGLKFSSVYIILTAGLTGYLTFVVGQTRSKNGSVDR
jgi:Chromate transport protein ChrA